MKTLVLAMVLLLPGDVDPATPVGMVLVPGAGATLERGKMPVRALRAMTILMPGDRLEAGDEPISLVILADGHGESVKQKSEVTIRPEGCAPASAVERQEARISAVHLDNLRRLATSGRSGALVIRASVTQPVPAVHPVNGATVLDGRPAFSWPIERGATRYIVELIELEGLKPRTVWTLTTTLPRLNYPADQPAIPPGGERRWRVRAVGAGDKEDVLFESLFVVATKEKANALEKVHRLASGTDPASWVLAAATFDVMGAFDEAYALYSRLASHFKEEPAFQRALASYYERAGHLDLAREARTKAEALESVTTSK